MQGTMVGDNATYTCGAGHVLTGPEVRRCKTDGTWSSREPICKGTSYLEQHSVLCTLNTNCVADREPSRTLQCTMCTCPYTPLAPSPTVVDCDVPDSIQNGYVSYSAGTTYQSSASYSCDTGYTLMGGAVRQCQANGTWSGGVPICASEWQQTA